MVIILIELELMLMPIMHQFQLEYMAVHPIIKTTLQIIIRRLLFVELHMVRIALIICIRADLQDTSTAMSASVLVCF